VSALLQPDERDEIAEFRRIIDEQES